MLRRLLLGCWIASVHSWQIDDRCLRRRHLIQNLTEAESSYKEKEIVDESLMTDTKQIRRLTERELQSSYRFSFRLHWKEGVCWQEEWIERFWCAQCQGDTCNDGDMLEIRKCKRGVSAQRFTWVPTKGGGRLKVGNMNLCLERISTNDFALKPCSTSILQVLVGFSPYIPFELNPYDNVNKKCLTQEHHPKPYEVLYTTTCDTARKSNTSFWQAYWPYGTYDPTIRPPTKTLIIRNTTCTPSSPCPQCVGNCAKDSDCIRPLKCYIRTVSKPLAPIPGCSGEGLARSGYCSNVSPTAAPTSSNGGPPMTNKTLVYPIVRCTPENPCDECQGDCRYDLDCKDDLVCFQKEGDISIPGCVGRDASRADWCVSPKYL